MRLDAKRVDFERTAQDRNRCASVATRLRDELKFQQNLAIRRIQLQCPLKQARRIGEFLLGCWTCMKLALRKVQPLRQQVRGIVIKIVRAAMHVVDRMLSDGNRVTDTRGGVVEPLRNVQKLAWLLHALVGRWDSEVFVHPLVLPTLQPLLERL